MTLYQVTQGLLDPVLPTNFSEERVLERKDLQQLLKGDVSPLGDDLMVIAEEFGQWEDSKRRIDLLCLDKRARLVVVELKRTDDGGHMDLQAIRYSAMVSSMTLDQAISAYAHFIGGEASDVRASKEILDFLGVDAAEEAELSGEVRIILVAGDFSPELTTSVIWLNKQGLDITCIRFKPYKLNNALLIDISQLIPLPESSEYEVKIRNQEQHERKVRTARQEIFRRFWHQLIERSKDKTQLLANRSTTTDHWLSAGIGRAGFSLSLSLTENRARVECYMRIGKDAGERSLAAFNVLLAQRDKIEASFGESLDWQELNERSGCRICKDFESSWHTPESEWLALQDRMIDAMIRLEQALREPVRQLQL